MKKIKFSAIDIFIVLFIILALVFGFIKLKDKGLVLDKPQKKVSFSIMASGVDEGSGSGINIGDRVCISLKEKEYANVTKVTEIPHKAAEFIPDLGKFVSEPVSGKSDLIVEFECMADVTENAILDGKAPIRVGENAAIHGKGYSFQGYIVTVEEKGEE